METTGVEVWDRYKVSQARQVDDAQGYVFSLSFS